MNVNEVTQLARDIRVATLKTLTQLGFGHYGGSMSWWRRWRYCMAR
jgi:transketolase